MEKEKKKCNFMSVFSIVISILSFVSAIIIPKYQIEQERLPSVVCLSHNIDISFETDYYDNTINSYKSIDEMRLKVYNLGVGVARNCEIRWDIESVKHACIQLKDSLKKEIDILEFESSEFANQFFSSYVYSYEFKNESLDSIWYYDDGLDDFIEHDFNIESTIIPYILPVTTDETNAYIEVPGALAVMLLEAGNRNVRESVELKLIIYYQDMAGKEYSDEVDVSIELKTAHKNVKDFGADRFQDNHNEHKCIYTIKTKK